MKNEKKPSLVDLEKRMSEWFSSYIAEHDLLHVGQRAILVLEVERHKTTHLYSSRQKVGVANTAMSHEPMTEMDWNIIMRLPTFRKPRVNSVEEDYVGELKQMRDNKDPQEIPYAHAQQINKVFAGTGLMYHVFKITGSTSSSWYGKPKFKVHKKL